MDGMIRSSTRLPDEAGGASGAGDARRTFRREAFLRDVVRTRRDLHEAARRGDRRGQLCQLAIGLGARLKILFRFHEGRRIGQHDVEAFARRPQPFQLFKSVGLDRGDFHAIGLGAFLGQRQRGCRRIQTDHFGRARLCRQDAKAARIGIGVQHALAFCQAGDEGAVVALVVIPARLLPSCQVGDITHAIFFHRDAGALALGRAGISFQPFERARRRVVAQDHRLGLQRRVQRLEDGIKLLFHAGRADLHRHHVVEAVHHQAGHKIAFGMQQPVERPVIQARPQGQRAGDLFGEESRVHRNIAFLGQQAHRDQAARIEIAGAKGPPIFPAHIDDAAGGDGLGDRVHLQLVGEDPGAARASAFALGQYDGFS